MKIGKPGNVRNPELLLDLTFFEVAYLSSHIQSPYGSQAINTTGRHYHSLAVYFRRELVKINDLFSQKNRKLLLYGGLMFGRVNDFYGGAYEISRHVLNYYNNPNITGDTIFITRYSVDLNQYTVLMVGGLDWKLPLTRGAVGRCAMISLQYNLGLRTLYGQTVNVQRNNDPNILQCELGTNGSGFVFKIGIELFKRRLE